MSTTTTTTFTTTTTNVFQPGCSAGVVQDAQDCYSGIRAEASGVQARAASLEPAPVTRVMPATRNRAKSIEL